MKRKTVLHGPSTLTVSLPASWVKKFNIQKGDELDVEEQGKELRIKFEKEPLHGRKEVDVQDLKRLGITQVTASYRNGYDEIALKYNDKNYLEIIQNIIAKEITGFEITEQEKGICVIKDITGHGKDEFDTMLLRIWMLTLNLSEQSLETIDKNDEKAVKNILIMDYSINKFANYCLRILMKKGHADFKKTPTLYNFIKNLEQIADQYKYLCEFQLENREKIDKKTVELFKKTNRNLNEFHQLFYKYDTTKIEELFKKIGSTQKRLLSDKSKISIYLATINNDIKNLLSALVEINL